MSFGMSRRLLCPCVGVEGLRLNAWEAREFGKSSRLAPGLLQVQRRTLRQSRPWPCHAMASDSSIPESDSSSTPPRSDDPLIDNTFCIIEGRDTVLDFAPMQLQEIREHINKRRTKIFLLMEEVRRLRIQQRIKTADEDMKLENVEQNDVPEFPSFIPFLPPLTPQTLKQYYVTCFALIAGIMLFAGLLAPANFRAFPRQQRVLLSLELRMGVGGTSYADFIHNMHLPEQLSQVDPIVASFSGGSVGVISALMVVELNNVKLQEQKRCTYCRGTGYLACARCSGSGTSISAEPLVVGGNANIKLGLPTDSKCPICAGAAKVMCPTCLCTGMALASDWFEDAQPTYSQVAALSTMTIVLYWGRVCIGHEGRAPAM